MWYCDVLENLLDARSKENLEIHKSSTTLQNHIKFLSQLHLNQNNKMRKTIEHYGKRINLSKLEIAQIVNFQLKSSEECVGLISSIKKKEIDSELLTDFLNELWQKKTS